MHSFAYARLRASAVPLCASLQSPLSIRPLFLTCTPTRALFLSLIPAAACCCCQSLDPAKYPLPEPYPYKEAAAFFAEPDVTPADQLPPLKWSAPDEEALLAFLVGE
jgi:hypothetical protein